MSGTLLIRADADENIGVGHVMRCLALAQMWRDLSLGQVCYVSRNLPAGLHERCTREGAMVRVIADGVSSLVDAIRDCGASWVVLDGYEFGVQEQRAVKATGRRLAVIDDDAAAGEYLADIVVDPNLFADEALYANRSAETRLLVGPQHALLRREFRECAATERVAGPIPNVLVSFGGADPAGLSERAAKALGALPLKLTMVLGPASSRRELLEGTRAATSIRVLRDPTNMREVMANADLAMVAAGGTCLELAHAGVPQIVVATSPNQRKVAHAVVERGIGVSLGEASNVTEAEIRRTVEALLRTPESLRTMRRRATTLVDGKGAERVVAAMTSVSA